MSNCSTSSGPVVKFMMEQLEKAGCPLKADHFRCTPCDITRAGGYAPKFGVKSGGHAGLSIYEYFNNFKSPCIPSQIILCQNRLLSKQHMEDTMTHEMIHAFDNCTAKVNWNDCLHVACSEIRAASLSGDCKFTRELRRGILGFSKHHQTCVKRRAILSLKGLPECCGEGTAEEAVNAVWKSCFNDTAPFDEIY